ncbi:MAG: tyrosine-type recombinase/integrase [Methanotrichaceae archaeon]|jgi:integrase/recombinase XerD
MHPEDLLSPAEFLQLLIACKTSRERAMLLLLGGVGLRVSEMAALKIEDLDIPAAYLYVRPENGKGEKARTCVLSATVIEALINYIEGRTEGYVFEGRHSGHISTRQIETILDEIATHAGLQNTKSGRNRITPHLLRHSFAIWTLEAGIDVGNLQQQLGHSSLATTGIYLRSRPNHRREAYKRSGFDKILRGSI